MDFPEPPLEMFLLDIETSTNRSISRGGSKHITTKTILGDSPSV
jgi:hypothetical protein